MHRSHTFWYVFVDHHPLINTQISSPYFGDHPVVPQMSVQCALRSLYVTKLLPVCSPRTGGAVCCVELLDAKATSGLVTAALALLLVRLILS